MSHSHNPQAPVFGHEIEFEEYGLRRFTLFYKEFRFPSSQPVLQFKLSVHDELFFWPDVTISLKEVVSDIDNDDHTVLVDSLHGDSKNVCSLSKIIGMEQFGERMRPSLDHYVQHSFLDGKLMTAVHISDGEWMVTFRASTTFIKMTKNTFYDEKKRMFEWIKMQGYMLGVVPECASEPPCLNDIVESGILSLNDVLNVWPWETSPLANIWQYMYGDVCVTRGFSRLLDTKLGTVVPTSNMVGYASPSTCEDVRRVRAIGH